MEIDDGFDYIRRERRPSPRRHISDSRRSQQLFVPGQFDGGGLGRTLSQGARPNPIIINNDIYQDQYNRIPPPPPQAGYMVPYPYPTSPEMRGRNHLGSDLADDFVDLAIENHRLRSRSRGRSDAAWADRREDYWEAELRRKEKLLAELERKASLEDERERLKQDWELQRLKDENKRKADEQAAKDERKRILDEYDLEQREKADKKKEEERQMREKIRQEQLDAEAKKKKEWEDFVAKYHAEEEKKKADKKKKDEEIDSALRNRLLDAGYSKAYADRIVEEDKNKKLAMPGSSMALIPGAASARPTYVKVHTDYLSVETLRYHRLPWEYDKKDKNYIVILCELSETQTELLFEHTRKLRQGKLFLEAPKKEPQYVWMRKRDRSRSRVKKLAIVKYDD